MRGRPRWRPQGEAGTTAVIFAVVVVLLFGLAALAVDLTNLYARDRAVQTVADRAAFAGVQALPDACEAFAEAFETLAAPGNAVQDDTAPEPPAPTEAQLSDGDLGNGEIQVLRRFDPTAVPPAPAFSADDVVSVSGCDGSPSGAVVDAGPGRIVRVTTPPRTVAFVFAGVYSVTEAAVRGVAAAQVASPEGATVLPFFLPTSCVTVVDGTVVGAPVVLVPDPAGATPDPSEPTYSPPGATDPPGGALDGPVIDAVDPGAVTAGGTSNLRISVSNLPEDPTLTQVSFDLHTGTGSTTTRSPLAPDAVPGAIDPLTVVSTGVGPDQRWNAQLDVAFDAAITATPAQWRVRAVQPPLDGRWTRDVDAGTFTVTRPPPPAGSCAGSTTGDLGVLDPVVASALPPDDGFVDGLLGVSAFSPGELPLTGTPCLGDGSPPGARLQRPAGPVPGTGDGATCVEVLDASTTDLGRLVADGLLSGGASGSGRLAAPPPDPSCAPPVGGDPDLKWTTSAGDSVLSTTLSCYLAPGSSLLDVFGGVEGSLREQIFADPRFAFVPVLGTADRPATGAWPVERFVGVFVTGERSDAEPATCADASDCNGITLDPATGEVLQLEGLVFPPESLPETILQPGNGRYFVAGTKDALLVE